jgi:hypothetical protein
MVLACERFLFEKLKAPEFLHFQESADLASGNPGLLSRLQNGDSLLFIGTRGLDFLQEIWVRAMPPEDAACTVSESAPWVLPPIPGPVRCRRFHLGPPQTWTQHGIHEEPRARILPFLVAQDVYGQETGSPAVLVRHDLGALTTGHYRGGRWFFFLFEEPEAVYPIDEWQRILDRVLQEEYDRCNLVSFQSQYVQYRPGEPIRVLGKVRNECDRVVPLTVVLRRTDGQGTTVADIAEIDLVVHQEETLDFSRDVYLSLKEGQHAFEAILYESDPMRYGPKRRDSMRQVDQARCLLDVHAGVIHQPIIEIDGTVLRIDGRDDFFLGTHYYPTNSFYERSYRAFDLETARATVRLMRSQGVRICRIWTDPKLDEESIRSMAALVRLLADQRIACIVTLFTSWVQTVEVNLPESQRRVEVASDQDESMIGLSLRDLEGQCAYVGSLVARFRHFNSIIWDLSNEFAVVDPDLGSITTNLPDTILGGPIGPLRNIAVFRHWAAQISRAIRDGGSDQPILHGCSCWDTGSENYRCCKSGALLADHLYHDTDHLAERLVLSHPGAIGKPFIVGEFGGLWPNMAQQAEEYMVRIHYFLAAGYSAACHYEWGVSWMTREMPASEPIFRALCNRPKEDYEGFILSGRYDYANSWAPGSFGICPWAASFEYGANASCSLSVTPVMQIMRSLSSFGRFLAWRPKTKRVCLLLPFETHGFERFKGYVRKTSLLDQTLNHLWRTGVDFMIWQVDELDSLPSSVAFVLYPAEDTVPIELAERLDALEDRGVRIFRQEPPFGEEEGSFEKIRFSSTSPCSIIVRDLQNGYLLGLFPEGRNPCRVTLEDLGLVLDVVLCSFVVVVGGKIHAVEACGQVLLNGEVFFESDSLRCLVTAGQGDLRSDDLQIDPLGQGEFILPSHLRHAHINASTGSRPLSIRRDGTHGIIAIGPDESNHTIHATALPV